MSTQEYGYQKVKEKLMPQMRKCRDKGVRTKVELILLVLKLRSVSLGCQRMGVGRTSFYKWWNRLVKGSYLLKALQEKSRRPKQSPGRIDGVLESRIKHYRKRGFGPTMIREYLVREKRRRLSPSTINHVINRRRKGHLKPKPARLKKHRKRYELPVPGQRLQIDVKYSPMEVAGQTVFIYVAIDECTRWRFAKAYPALNEHWTIDFLEHIERGFPFPIQGIQTDNGHEFTFKLFPGNTREHGMDAWCRHKGIKHRLIPPGVKELNGKVERSHRIDADYFYGRAPTKTLSLFNRALDQWIRDYNLKRPHGGISYMTPVEKLHERLRALKTEGVASENEPIRQKFIESVKLMNDQDDINKTAA